MAYMSEAAKVRDLPEVMKYITGDILDFGCGGDKIVPHAIGIDGRKLPGVDVVSERLHEFSFIFDLASAGFCVEEDRKWDTIFSSHLLEHLVEPYAAIIAWASLLKQGGHLILYLPDGDHYDNKANPEHMVDMKYEPFMFWFRRAFCGEGKDFKGEHLPAQFELVDHGLDVGEDRYSFYLVARKA